MIFFAEFSKEPTSISSSDKKEMERFFKVISNYRARIAEELALLGPGVRKFFIKDMVYNDEICSATTKLREEGLYTRYIEKLETGEKKYLMLGSISRALGVYDRGDDEIELGHIEKTEPLYLADSLDGEKVYSVGEHVMGTYREEEFEGAIVFSLSNIARVDEVTAIALKKALFEDDFYQKIKNIFIFGILRGYNLRSAVGACWAQEMSMRYLLAKSELPQFRKNEGVFLDIEACFYGDNIEVLLEKMTSQYQAVFKRGHGQGDIFLIPFPTKEGDFHIYEAAKHAPVDFCLESRSGGAGAAASNLNEELSRAIDSGNAKEIYELVKRGCDINGFIEDGYTPLCKAVIAGKKEVAKILIENGANVATVLGNGHTAFSLAIHKHNKLQSVASLDLLKYIGEKDYESLLQNMNEVGHEVSKPRAETVIPPRTSPELE